MLLHERSSGGSSRYGNVLDYSRESVDNAVKDAYLFARISMEEEEGSSTLLLSQPDLLLAQRQRV